MFGLDLVDFYFLKRGRKSSDIFGWIGLLDSYTCLISPGEYSPGTHTKGLEECFIMIHEPSTSITSPIRDFVLSDSNGKLDTTSIFSPTWYLLLRR